MAVTMTEPMSDYAAASDELVQIGDRLRDILRAIQTDAAGVDERGEPRSAGGSKRQWDAIEQIRAAIGAVYWAATRCRLHHEAKQP